MIGTKFIAKALDLHFHEPDTKKVGTSQVCYLCGGEAGEMPFLKKDAISQSFTQTNSASAPDSDSVCVGCAAVLNGKVFQEFITKRKSDIKIWGTAGWQNYSHFITESGVHECPNRLRMREILVNPPSEPWILAINPTGQKHTLFMTKVATSRDVFPVQFDQTSMIVKRSDFEKCLSDFEALTEMGFSKDSVLTSNYHHAQMLKIGIAKWKPAEERIQKWRDEDLDLLTLVSFVAFGPAHFADGG